MNAADPKVQFKFKDLEKFERQRLDSDLKNMLKDPSGCRVLLWIVYSVCGLEGGIDEFGDMAAHYNGRRWVARELLAKAREVAPGMLSQAISMVYAERADAESYKAAAETKSSDEDAEENFNG